MTTQETKDNLLIKAAKQGMIPLIKELLAEGANVHAGNDYALRWASGNGHIDTVAMLLEAGADVHAEDDYALRWASHNGHTEILTILKNHIAKKN